MGAGRVLSPEGGRIAAFSLGSSMGDRGAALRFAALALQRLPATRPWRASRVYATAPIGGVARRPFLNAVVCVRTALEVDEIALFMRQIERRAGRRAARRWADRRLDVDLLLLGEERHTRPGGLVVPHPRLAERPFLLVALFEAWPEAPAPDGAGPWRERVGPLAAPPVVGVLPGARVPAGAP